MSITRRVVGVTSTNAPRVQCTSPVGERMHTLKAPPTHISTSATGTVKVSGQNQRFTCSAELQALNTVARGAWSVRESLSGGGSCIGAVSLVSVGRTITPSFAFHCLEVVTQAVEAMLPL